MISASWNRGFQFANPVYEHYVTKDRVLQVQEDRNKIAPLKRFVAPAGDPSLLERLALVPQGKVTPEQFASEYGLLGYFHLVNKETLSRSQIERLNGGDPIKWFEAHAKNVFDILRLLEAIGKKDERAVVNYLDKMPTVGDVLNVLAEPHTTEKGIESVKASRSKLSERFWAIAPTGEPIQAGRKLVASKINQHLPGTCRELIAEADGLRSVFRPRALVDIVYWQLADYAELQAHGQAAIRHCLGCGSLFIAADPRRRYCQRKSCGSGMRVRVFREKQKRRKRQKKHRGKSA